jgi:hypothetical protein
MKTTIKTIAFAAGFAVLLLSGCSLDPKMGELRDAVDLMSGIVRSRIVLDTVRGVDPEMRPSTAARAALSGGVVANFPQPPEHIYIEAGETPSQPWSVVLIGDDEKKQVRIEGYGEDLSEPKIVEKIKFPPE